MASLLHPLVILLAYWLIIDIYAIGAVGYFLLTGTPVFAGKTVMEICLKHTNTMPERPSVRLGRPVSPGLESLILRCLAKNPKDRPPSARALAALLDRLEADDHWTQIDAEAWWASFKKPEGAGTERDSNKVDDTMKVAASPISR